LNSRRIIGPGEVLEGVRLELFFPNKEKYPSISITGDSCDLMCKHCMGFYLRYMLDASKDGLYKTCLKAKSHGAIGALISGGSDNKGKVPFDREGLKRTLKIDDFVTNLHVGLLENVPVEYCYSNTVSIDVPPSDNVVRNIYNLKDRGRQDYMEMIGLLEEAKVNYVPHLCVGIENGKVSGELETLELLESYSFDRLVILSMKVTPGAQITKNRVNAVDYEKVLKMARDKFKYLCLGCMRDKDKEKEKLWHYFDKIAWPSKIIKDELEKNGIVVQKYDTCCSV